MIAVVATLASGCGGDDRTSGTGPTTTPAGAAQPRQLTAAETERLALFRSNAYEAHVRSVDGVVSSEGATVQLRGWIDTVEHWGYGMVGGADVAPFLVMWTQDEVSAQPFTGTEPPLPIPADGWESVPLHHETSHLAAAQVLLLSLASNAPENPQLLRQSGARWLRTDRVGTTAVDVVSGPVPDGAMSSSYRYWIDGDSNLLRLEARLDGVRWSSFNLADASDVPLSRP